MRFLDFVILQFVKLVCTKFAAHMSNQGNLHADNSNVLAWCGPRTTQSQYAILTTVSLQLGELIGSIERVLH